MLIHNVKLDEEELKYLKVAVSNDAIVVSRQINLAKKENNEKAYNYWKKEKEFFHNLYEKLDFPVPEE